MPKVLLPTFTAWVMTEKGEQCIRIRALLDTGSTITCIREEIAQGLKIKQKALPNFTLLALSGTKIDKKLKEIDFILTDRNAVEISMSAIVLPVIAGRQSAHFWNPRQEFQIPERVKLADVFDNVPRDIDLLVGQNFFWEICTGKIIKLKLNWALMETVFGYALQGAPKSVSAAHCLTIDVTNNDLDDLLTKFWSIESFESDTSTYTVAEHNAMMIFHNKVQYKDGVYHVPILWKTNRAKIVDNYHLVLKQYQTLMRRFKANPEFQSKYVSAMNEYFKRDDVEQVDMSQKPDKVCYLPHSAVVRNDHKTTKVRIVFNGSVMMPNRVTLNQCIYPGPVYINDLLKILINFRLNPVAFSADIEKCFLKIDILKEDRDVLRFFWLDKNGNSEPPTVYRLKRVTFGVIDSPYKTCAIIKLHSEKYKDKYPEAVKAIMSYMYVDDLIYAAEDEKTAQKVIKDILTIMKEGNFELKKWNSNVNEVLKNLPNDIIDKEEQPFELGHVNSDFEMEDIPKEQKVKTLGLYWNPKLDVFMYKAEMDIDSLSSLVCTKRSICSVVAKIYDPLGLASPFIITAKMIIQALWALKLDWDTKLPEEVEMQFLRWAEQIPLLKEYRIPRCIKPKGEVKNIQIHAFGDASIKAYGSACYVRYETNETVTSMLVMSKSKVAPVEKHTLPRLELMAACMSADLAVYVAHALNVNKDCITCWSDSLTALLWVKKGPHSWKSFIGNRVQKIENLLKLTQYRHVPGVENPGDMPSRGMPLAELMQSKLWHHGPSWLVKTSDHWPQMPEVQITKEAAAEQRKATVLFGCVEQDLLSHIADKVDRYTKLLRIIARILFWKKVIKNKSNRKNIFLEAQKDANLIILRNLQKHYIFEYENIKNGKSLHKKSALIPLAPFYDKKDGLIKADSRLQQSSEQQAAPIILPRLHKVVDLLILKAHLVNGHSSPDWTLARMRETFWIPKGRFKVQKVLKTCLRCQRLHKTTLSQKMAALPESRITSNPPFDTIGMDLFGPLFVASDASRQAKRKKKKTKKVANIWDGGDEDAKDDLNKVWVVIFTCNLTRAIHLELIPTMETSSIILALRLFIAIRGKPSFIITDNAKQFKRLDKELSILLKEIDFEAIQQDENCNDIQWHFAPEFGQHQSGATERLVGTVKNSMKKVVGNTMLTYHEMSAVIKEIQEILNERPLTATSSNFTDPKPLTPNDLILAYKKRFLPFFKTKIRTEEPTAIEIVKRWKQKEEIVKHFWNAWTKIYIAQLAQRPKWAVEKVMPKEGQLVLIKDENLPRLRWPIATVTSVNESERDKRVRSVMLRTSKGYLRRPITKIVHLELPSSDI